MGIDHRRHPRHTARLAVRYSNAAEFVLQYTENLSLGGLFIAGARDLELHSEISVDIELPGHGTFRVRAKLVFILDEATAAASGRTAGAGMEITHKPPGFEDALFAYLLRLGRRRDFAVMVGDVPGASRIKETGYHVLALEGISSFVSKLINAPVPILAVIVPPATYPAYEALARSCGSGEIVHSAGSVQEFKEIMARLDGLL